MKKEGISNKSEETSEEQLVNSEKSQEASEKSLKERCEALAIEQYGETGLKKMSMTHKGLFYIPILKNNDILAYGIFRPITRFDLKVMTDIVGASASTFDGLEQLVEDTCVGGTEGLLDNPVYFQAVSNELMREINQYKTETVKH